MTNSFCILTTRFGRDKVDPISVDLESAIDEVFSLQDDEHPNTWLRFGSDKGEMFTLDVYHGCRIVFEQWADTEYETELAPPGQLVLSRQEVQVLWQSLQAGDIDGIRSQAWILVD